MESAPAGDTLNRIAEAIKGADSAVISGYMQPPCQESGWQDACSSREWAALNACSCRVGVAVHELRTYGCCIEPPMLLQDLQEPWRRRGVRGGQ